LRQPKKKVMANLPEPIAREQAAEVCHVSPRNVQKAKAVQQADPDLFEEVIAGKTTVNKAYKKVKMAEAQEKVKRQQSVEPAPNAPIVDLAECREWIEKQPHIFSKNSE